MSKIKMAANGSHSLFVVCTYNQTTPWLLQFAGFYYRHAAVLIGFVVQLATVFGSLFIDLLNVDCIRILDACIGIADTRPVFFA